MLTETTCEELDETTLEVIRLIRMVNQNGGEEIVRHMVESPDPEIAGCGRLITVIMAPELAYRRYSQGLGATRRQQREAA